MRIPLSLLILLITTFSALQGQKLYLRAHGTLAAPAARDILEVSSVTDSSGYYSQQNVETTLGGGLLFGLDVGHQFNEFFAVELGFQFLASNKVVARETASSALNINAIAYTRMGRMSLGLALNTGGTGLRGTTRMGALLPVFGATFIEVEFALKPPLPPINSFTKTRNDGQFSIGWYGGVGFDYPIGERIRLSAELAMTYLRVKTNTQTTLEQYDLDTGEDLLPGLSVGEKEIIFRDRITQESNSRTYNPLSFDPDLPDEQLAYTSNYSNVGLKIGLAFTLFQ